MVSVEDDGVGGLLRLRICSSSSSSVEEVLRVLKSRTVGNGVAVGETSTPLVGDMRRPGVAAGGEHDEETRGDTEPRESGEWPSKRRWCVCWRYAAITAAECGGRRGWPASGRGTMLLGLTGLALLRAAVGGGLAAPEDSRESLDRQRGLIGSLQQRNETRLGIGLGARGSPLASGS